MIVFVMVSAYDISFFFFSSRRRHTRLQGDWSSDVCSSDLAEIERQTVALARALDVVGLMNVQFAVKDGEVYVLEVNPRASRTVPFVAKATGVPIAKIAARLMVGES